MAQLKYNINFKLTEYEAYSLDILSQKYGVDYTNLIRIGIAELIKNSLTIEEQTRAIRDVLSVNDTWDKLNEGLHKEWIAHWNSLSENHKILIDIIYQKCLKEIYKDPEFLPFPFDKKEYDELIKKLKESPLELRNFERYQKVLEKIPEWTKLNHMEQHRIYMTCFSQQRHDPLSIDFFRMLREFKTERESKKNEKTKK